MARKGWSLRKLAREVKTDASHLGRFLKGKRGLGLDTALAIAKALELPIESLGSDFVVEGEAAEVAEDDVPQAGAA